MKNYKITVNGTAYEVSVEDVGGAPEVQSIRAAAPTPRAAPAPRQVEPRPVAQRQAAPAHAAGSAGGGDEVVAPLPGTVISINVAVGDAVQADQVLVVFEAMKMENEIVAPRAGTISKIFVAKGDALEAGKAVVAIN